MDSKKVSALLTAIDRGSLTAAASELGYTQSGLTHMMNSLEDELGVSLLIRSKGGVRLSPTGQELLPKLKGFADAAAALEREADQLRLKTGSALRLGSFSSIAPLDPGYSLCIQAALPGHAGLAHGQRHERDGHGGKERGA